MTSLTPHEVFEILVREHAEMLSVYLRTVVRDPGAVDDLFQETMLVAWRRLADFDRKRPFGPWLRGIAGRLVLAYQRKTARGAVLCDAELLEHLEVRMSALHKQSGDTFDDKLTGLRECIEALPDRYREAVQLRYREELSTSNLVERLEISPESVKKRLQRGRARLLDCLERKLSIGETS